MLAMLRKDLYVMGRYTAYLILSWLVVTWATVHNFTPPPPASAARAVITARQPYANRYFAGTICQGRRGVTAAKRSQRPSSALTLFSEMVSENIAGGGGCALLALNAGSILLSVRFYTRRQRGWYG